MTSDFTLVEAVCAALARAMTEDPDVVVFGEDVGVDGGVFRATDGLLDRFGPDRVLDAPISESLFVGLGVGMAAQGLRPVIEYQFMGFLYPGIDQLANHASRIRNRTRGRLTCPMVSAPRTGAACTPPSTTRRASRRCSLTSRACASSSRRHPLLPTGCCSPRSATRSGRVLGAEAALSLPP